MAKNEKSKPEKTEKNSTYEDILRFKGIKLIRRSKKQSKSSP
ncbi:MAG: hypothetical protein ACFFBD_02635 [Candidatus Hodarchaeota archaeon]